MRRFECVDCPADIIASDRGPFSKRCPDCSSKRKRKQRADSAIARKARGHVAKKQSERTATKEAKADVAARRAASQALGCRICGSALSGMQLLYCSRKCTWTAELNRNRPTFAAIPCAECATSFVPKSSQGKYCSRKCLHKARDRIYVTRRNLRVKAGEKIDPVKVFERDGWRCRECKTRTPAELRGTQDDRAPEMDHITSLRDGGEHLYSNVQCLCRKCNAEKGRKSRGQMWLGLESTG